jgi:hypothetical protein
MRSVYAYTYRVIINDLSINTKLVYFLNIHTRNDCTTVWKLIQFIWRCSICAPLVTLHTSTLSSNSSHARQNCDPSTLATPCEIRCRRNRGIGGRHTWSFTFPHTYKSPGVRSGDVRGQGMSAAFPIVSYAPETPFSFDSDWCATRG